MTGSAADAGRTVHLADASATLPGVTLAVMQPPGKDDPGMEERRRDHLADHILPDAVPGR